MKRSDQPAAPGIGADRPDRAGEREAPAHAAPLRRVVIADDNPDDRDLIRRTLRQAVAEHIEIEEAACGEEALELLVGGPDGEAPPLPDCLLLDMRLPDLSGLEVLSELRVAGGGHVPCPVVIVTGSEGEERPRDVLAAGAQDYIAKGWLRPALLLRVIENAIERFALDARDRERALRLERSEAMLRDTLDAINTYAAVLDAQGRIVGLNRTAIEGGGVAEAEVLGLAFCDGPWWQHSDKARQTVADAVARASGGGVAQFESSYLGAEGRVGVVEVRIAPTRDAAGRVARLIVSGVDVTERVNAERQRRLALESAGMGVWEFDVRNDALFWDSRCRELFGIEAATTPLGPPLERVHPDDVVRVRALLDAATDPAGDGEYAAEYRVAKPLDDGDADGHRWIRAVGRCSFADEGAERVPGLFSGVMMDITERRRAEEAADHAMSVVSRNERELRTITGNVPDIIARFDRELRHVFVNDAVTKATGMEPCDFLGKTNRDLEMPDEICSHWERCLHAAFESGRPQECEFTFDAPDGPRHYEARIVPELDADGNVATVLGITRDATHRKNMEAQLRASMEEAERANVAKDQFLAVLSHELRTPLTPVLAAAGELATRRDLPGEVLDDLAMIRRNVELEARLMDDLLDLTRVSRGKLELNFAAIDAHEKARRVMEMVGAEADGKQVTLTLDAEAEHAAVLADSARLQQILWNLVKNAVKFTPPGGTVWIRTSNARGSGADDRLRVDVSDTGAGIEPALLPRIFDAFEQGGDAVTRQFGGLGLGLAICKVLVEAHGGTIEASSAGRGKGARFVVELPVAAPAEAAGENVEHSPGREGARLHVLLVEDHVDTARIAARLLRRRGMTVRTADSVANALRSVEAEAFDVIVSDLGLPDGSGHDFLRQARAIGVRTPAIVVSGFGTERDRAQSRDAGFSEHLTKPIDFDHLVDAIRRVAVPARAMPQNS